MRAKCRVGSQDRGVAALEHRSVVRAVLHVALVHRMGGHAEQPRLDEVQEEVYGPPVDERRVEHIVLVRARRQQLDLIDVIGDSHEVPRRARPIYAAFVRQVNARGRATVQSEHYLRKRG